MLANLRLDLTPQGRTAVKHGQKDTLQGEPRIESLLDNAERLEQFRQALQSIVLALDGNQQRAACNQSVQGQQAKGRWTVEKDEVRLFLGAGHPSGHNAKVDPQGFGELPLSDTLAALQQLGFGAHQVTVGRDNGQPGDVRCMNTATDRAAFDQDLICRCGEVFLVEAQAGCGVSLGVEVDDKDQLALVGKRGGEVDGRCGLTHAPLLIGNRNRPAQPQLPGMLLSCSTWNLLLPFVRLVRSPSPLPRPATSRGQPPWANIAQAIEVLPMNVPCGTVTSILLES